MWNKQSVQEEELSHQEIDLFHLASGAGDVPNSQAVDNLRAKFAEWRLKAPRPSKPAKSPAAGEGDPVEQRDPLQFGDLDDNQDDEDEFDAYADWDYYEEDAYFDRKNNRRKNK